MRRTAEMVLGLIGSSIGTIIYLMVFITIAINPPIDFLFTIGVFIMMLLQVIALVLSCLVNKINHIAYGISIIVIGVLTFIFFFDNVYILVGTAILYIVAGAIACFRSKLG
ncbi:hypothetical protein [Fictibacillus terranigra]|uniref:DUF4064 domain-containing protein n=1 Tax=Fictibacillus terranigra TaxID=3058424 RepID=A0ABT8E4S7_9BACL|nr:hypothetical protein [Fictibacillus sp. CENA-BCM004]MDN4072923.1 hypothetical protein [Fictibacillus sp. CENA-BCM004]MDN4073339.1 hypothetical protein [Fictibacillus sp. CENA-BCM004]